VRYLRRGSEFPPKDDPEPCLYILRRGAVDMRDGDGNLAEQARRGRPLPLALRGRRSALAQPARPDLGGHPRLSAAVQGADRLREEHQEFAEHFDESMSQRLRKALEAMRGEGAGTELMTVQVGHLLRKELVFAQRRRPASEAAAKIMSEGAARRWSCCPKTVDLAGIVTDRDLRNRCLAAGLSPERPVREIMTERLHTVAADTLGFEALITMSRLNVHHLPVVDEGGVRGVLSTSDLVRVQSANAVYLVGDIRKADSVETLAAISSKLPELQVQLVGSGATANQIGQAITAVTDAITMRLLELAEAELGAPPVPYCWMAGGSQARREQSSHSDQDNALLIADHMRPEDDAYFAMLAKRVNDGLNACGYIYCPGDVMASNDKWRQPLKIWTKYFNTWIKRPEPMALMLSSVFFDLRAIHDPNDLFGELVERVREICPRSRPSTSPTWRPTPSSTARRSASSASSCSSTAAITTTPSTSSTAASSPSSIWRASTASPPGWKRPTPSSACRPPAPPRRSARTAPRTSSTPMSSSAPCACAIRRSSSPAATRRTTSCPRTNSRRWSAGHLKDAFSLINTMQESLGQRYQAGRFA
jgi:CBS domain-containing protein